MDERSTGARATAFPCPLAAGASPIPLPCWSALAGRRGHGPQSPAQPGKLLPWRMPATRWAAVVRSAGKHAAGRKRSALFVRPASCSKASAVLPTPPSSPVARLLKLAAGCAVAVSPRGTRAGTPAAKTPPPMPPRLSASALHALRARGGLRCGRKNHGGRAVCVAFPSPWRVSCAASSGPLASLPRGWAFPFVAGALAAWPPPAVFFAPLLHARAFLVPDPVGFFLAATPTPTPNPTPTPLPLALALNVR